MENTDIYRENWEDVEKLETLPIKGKVTVVHGRIESSINGQSATILSFEGVNTRAAFYYQDSKGDEKVKSPRITRLEKGSDGTYRFHLSDGTWLFEPLPDQDE